MIKQYLGLYAKAASIWVNQTLCGGRTGESLCGALYDRYTRGPLHNKTADFAKCGCHCIDYVLGVGHCRAASRAYWRQADLEYWRKIDELV